MLNPESAAAQTPYFSTFFMFTRAQGKDVNICLLRLCRDKWCRGRRGRQNFVRGKAAPREAVITPEEGLLTPTFSSVRRASLGIRGQGQFCFTCPPASHVLLYSWIHINVAGFKTAGQFLVFSWWVKGVCAVVCASDLTFFLHPCSKTFL